MDMEEGGARVRNSRDLEPEVCPTGMSTKTLLLAGGKVGSSGILSRFPLTFPVFLKMGWTDLNGTDHMLGYTPSLGLAMWGRLQGQGRPGGAKTPQQPPGQTKLQPSAHSLS